VALALSVLVLLVLPLLALATFTPRPFEVSVVLLGLFAAAATGFVARDAFLSMCAFLLLTTSVFTAGTMAESARVLSPLRRRNRRRRRRPRPAYGAGELAPPPALPARLRDAA
jgi:predicted anti-sigma-YlaC factor YlaD